MELKTIAAPKVPVRYYEGGSGTPLVFLHGAGGILPNDPFLAKLTEKYHVYAPLLPG
jgi:pimeloyl-ACP methyl ester carboxylesterase